MQPIGSAGHAKPGTSVVTTYRHVCPSAVLLWHANYEVIIFTLVAFFFTPGRNRSCPGSLKTVLFQRPGKKYRVLNHARFYPVLPERTRVKSVD